jgi:hypothetical protein
MYEVLGTVRHSESDASLVLYRCLYGDFSLWVRPLDMFLETVQVEGAPVPRFAWIDAECSLDLSFRPDGPSDNFNLNNN